MRQDNRGCRRMLVGWTVGMIVLALSIAALIGIALRDAEPAPVQPELPEVTVTRDGMTERAGDVSDLVEPDRR